MYRIAPPSGAQYYKSSYPYHQAHNSGTQHSDSKRCLSRGTAVLIIVLYNNALLCRIIACLTCYFILHVVYFVLIVTLLS